MSLSFQIYHLVEEGVNALSKPLRLQHLFLSFVVVVVFFLPFITINTKISRYKAFKI